VGRWVPLVVVGVLVGGGAGYYWGVYEPEQAERREEEARKAAAARAVPPVQPTAPVLDAGLPPAPEPDAGEPDAGFDAGQPIPDAGAPVIDAGAAAPVVVDAGAPVVDAGVPKRVTFDGLLAQADRLRDNGRPEAALDLYGRAHEMKPERVEPLTGRGLTLLDMGNAVVAQGVFEDALKLNDRYGPAIMGLAECLRLQNKNAKAVEYYQRYLDVSPEGSEAAVARNNIDRLKK
jgi:tetratricopeptide (TPR) repeat protein